MSSQALQLWQRAVDGLEDDLASAIRDIGPARKHGALQTISRIAEESRRECVNKRWKVTMPNGEVVVLRDKMEKLIHWVDRFKQVGDIAVQYDPTVAALPWAGVRFILQAAVNDVEVFEATALGIETVARLIARHARTELMFTRGPPEVVSQLDLVLLELYTEILRFLAKAVAYFRTRKAKRVLKSPFQAVETFQLSKVLEKDSEVSRVTDLLANEALFGAHDTLQGLDASMIRLCSQADRFYKARVLDDSREILRWLSSVPYIQHHKHHSQQRLPGTGQWLLRHPRLTDWLSSSSSSILILHGIPGCGKTSLASLVIDAYRTNLACSPRPVAPVAYFYCSRSTSEPGRSDAGEIMRSLVRQIATGHENNGQTSNPLIVHASVMAEFERRQAQAARDGFDTERLSASDCVTIIRTFTASEPLTIIVDAIDEVAEDDLDTLVSALQDVVRQSENVTKILLTNRDDGQLFSLLPRASRIRISSADVQGDMTKFVEHEVSTAIRQRRLLGGEVDEETRENIQRALVSRAGEMFQGAKLQLERMCLMKTAWDIRKMEQSLPATLRDLYNDVFRRLYRSGDLSTTLATHAFQWLLHVQKPLSTVALIEAIKSSASDVLKCTKVNITLSMVEDVCMHLVITDSELNIVRLSHVSVREYLLERSEFQAESAHGLIARSCLRASCFLMPMGDDDNGDEQSLENTYTNYAIAYWPMHYQCVRSSNQPRDAQLEETLLGFVLDGCGQPTTEFMIWIDWVYWVSRRISRDDVTYKRLAAVVNDQSSPLFVAAEYGIVDIIRKLDAWSRDAWDRKNELGNTALYLASVAGHFDVVELLIERGASLNRRGGKLGTPVHAAAFHARGEVVSLLLKAGADPRNGVFSSAVEAALTANHGGFALNLLQQESPSLSTEEYQVLMECASRGGHVGVVQWIRHRLFHDGMPDTLQRSLAKAIQHGKLGVIEYLLRKQPSSDNILPIDAIALAALYGQEDVLVLCLRKGSAIDKPGPFGTPIRTASLMGRESIVRVLLAHGARTTVDQPLQAAALRNHIDVVKTLLYVGSVGANEPGGTYETAITSAAYHGHESIVKMLLDSGADPIAASGTASRFVNAYQAAIEGGHARILEMFHEKDFSFQTSVEPFRGLASRGSDKDMRKKALSLEKLNPSGKGSTHANHGNLNQQLDAATSLPPRKHDEGYLHLQTRYTQEAGQLLLAHRVSGMEHAHIIALLVRAVESGSLTLVQALAPELSDLLTHASLVHPNDRKAWVNKVELIDDRLLSWNPLEAAALHGHIDVVVYLLGIGERDATFQDSENLLRASVNGNTPIIDLACELLTEESRKPRALPLVREWLDKALLTAVDNSRTETVAMLLGTQSLALDYPSTTPVYKAWSLGKRHSERMNAIWDTSLLATPSGFNGLAERAIKCGNYDMVQLFLGFNVTVTEVMLLLASHVGNAPILSLLVDKRGGAIHLGSLLLQKCLVIAAYKGSRSVVKQLLHENINLMSEVEGLPFNLHDPEKVQEEDHRTKSSAIGSDLEHSESSWPAVNDSELVTFNRSGDVLISDGLPSRMTAIMACSLGFKRFDLEMGQTVCASDSDQDEASRATQDEASRATQDESIPTSEQKSLEVLSRLGDQEETLIILLNKVSEAIYSDDRLAANEKHTSDLELVQNELYLTSVIAVRICRSTTIELAMSLYRHVYNEEPTDMHWVAAATRMSSAEEGLQILLDGSEGTGLIPHVYTTVPYAFQALREETTAELSLCLEVVRNKRERGAFELGRTGSHLGDIGQEILQKFSSVLNDGPSLLIRKAMLQQPKCLTREMYNHLLLLAAFAGAVDWIELLLPIITASQDLDLIWSEQYGNLSPLEAASITGRADVVSLLLASISASHSSLSELARSYDQALLSAIAGGHETLATYFVKERNNRGFEKGQVPAEWLIRAGSSPMLVEAMLQAGARASSAVDGMPILLTSKHSEVTQLLLEAGADALWLPSDSSLSPASVRGWRRPRKIPVFEVGPLHQACRNGDAKSVALLLSYGADPSKKLGCGTPLVNACLSTESTADDRVEIVRLLLEKAESNSQSMDEDLIHALDVAVDRRDVAVVEELVSSGAEVFSLKGLPRFGSARYGTGGHLEAEIYDGGPRNALDAIVEHPFQPEMLEDKVKDRAQTLQIARLLLNAVESAGESAYENYARNTVDGIEPVPQAAKKAVQVGDKELFEMMAEYLPFEPFWFHGASLLGSVSTIDQMLASGINIDVEDSRGIRAIHLAAHHLQCETVRYLCDNDAEVTHISDTFGTPLMAAMEGGLEKMYSRCYIFPLNPSKPIGGIRNMGDMWLVDHKSLRQEAASGLLTPMQVIRNIEDQPRGQNFPRLLLRTVQILLNNGADANAPPGFFGSALQIACFLRSEALVKLLLEHGATVDVSGGWLQTPLLAAMFGEEGGASRAIVRMLLERGASPNTAPDVSWKLTPLGFACHHGTISSLQLLLTHGADANAPGYKGKSVMAAALKRGNPAVVWALLRYGRDVQVTRSDYRDAIREENPRMIFGRTIAEMLAIHSPKIVSGKQ
ncbi:hypothetical protein CI238_11683 [Colletotrichum incanum]|uniref:Ankyrin repeat protein n=1 Tax=Colletotrichum incanum TaxID=1573173 RepID=A0A167DU21_COLIC|nr:hypothetical protein CI238_11683 [Colletotrichum incanum]